MSRVSVIIPALNEESVIGNLLRWMEAEHPHEILVADGGSTDSTASIAARYAQVIQCPRGRAVQMNTAARQSSGDVVWFLHADALPASGALAAIAGALRDPRVIGGNFDIRFAGGDLAASVFTRINRSRCRFGIFYGDSGIFCRREIFERLGGFPEWPILEDYHFARRMWRSGRVVFLRHPIHVSDRRWRNAGLVPTLWSWFWIQGLHLVGVPAATLARMYRDVR